MLYAFIIQAAFAETDKTCDVKAISTEIVSKRGDAAAEAYHALVGCDQEVAKKFTVTTVPTFFPSAIGYTAAADAVVIDGDKTVYDWYKTLDTSEQKGLLRELGNRCQQEPAIQEYFLNVAQNKTAEFWNARYHQYITDCRVEPLQTLLKSQLEQGVEQGRSQYFSVMSAMARNLEGEALPKLKELLASTDDGEVQVNIIASIFEAVDESNQNHADDKKLVRDVTIAGIDAVYSNKETLAPEAVLQARTVLTALDAEAESDELAGFMYKPLQQPDGTYMWGLVVVENATCKNGKEKQRLYISSLVEGGTNWADQVSERVKDVAGVQWDLNLAVSCKGTGETLYLLSDTPIPNLDALHVWQTEQKESHLNSNVKKPIVITKDALGI
jgi:hypothetical protein